MRIERALPGLRDTVEDWRRQGLRIGLVPTMGSLHAGHMALVAAARQAADRVIASIFVNPLQFLPGEDLARYPRDEAGDLAKLDAAGCDLAWLPEPEVIYPPGAATVVEPIGTVGGSPAEGWEGAARPGHFRGVATVCAKLFLMTRADVAVFGEKDWQQLQVVRRMVTDLHLPLRILPLATQRDAAGLALSSRNARLSDAQRQQAALLPAALLAAAAALAAGEPPTPLLASVRASLSAQGFTPDYVALVEPESLHPWPEGALGEARLIAAVGLGDVRLLDNVPVTVKRGPGG